MMEANSFDCQTARQPFGNNDIYGLFILSGRYEAPTCSVRQRISCAQNTYFYTAQQPVPTPRCLNISVRCHQRNQGDI